MVVDASECAPPEVERLLLDLARVCHWTGLYQPGHPFLAERVACVHSALSSRIDREPGNRLLLGIARDKVLYGEAFLGQGHPLVRHFTEALYLHQVATLAFSPDVTPEGLTAFFRRLHDSRSGKVEGTLEEILKREPVPGIFLSPYNYTEALSRRIDGRSDGPTEAGREDALWRMLITADVAPSEGESRMVAELAEAPELIPAILRRARAAEKGGAPSGTPVLPGEGSVSPEVLRRMFRRLGETLRALPDDRRTEVLLFLDQGLGDAPLPEVSATQSLADGFTDDEFLDLLAALVSVEAKGGQRLRKIFEIIANERDVHGSLLPRLNERARESLRARQYVSVKTWETVERLLLSRSENAYLGEDHSLLMETLSGGAGPESASAGARPADPVLMASFGEEEMHRQAVMVLLELVAGERDAAALVDLLEEIRKCLPNMISRKEFGLLSTALGALAAIRREGTGTAPEEVEKVLGEVDFGHIVDLYVSRAVSAEDGERIPSILSAFGTESIHAVLDRLLMEPEAGRRRLLMSLAIRIGPQAVPEVVERLSHPRWYFVRNLCLVLGEIGVRDQALPLLRVLEHPDLRVRREATAALGKLRVPEAVPALGRILLAEAIFASPKEDSLRMDAASALFRIGGTEALGYVHRGTGSRRPAVREHCAALLLSGGKP